MAQFMVDAFNTVSCKFFWTKVQKRVSNALARWWQISFNTWRSWRESHALVTATMSSARNGIWLARSWTRCSTSLVLPMSIWARGSDVAAVYERVSCHILSRHFGGGLHGGVGEHRRVALLPGAWRQVEGTVAIPSQAYGYYRGYDWGASGERGEETPLSGGNHEEYGCPEGLVWVGVVDGEGIWSMNVACHLIALKHS